MQHSPSLSIQQKKPKLLDQVRNTLRTKHYSLRTEESYVHWIKQFILYHDKKHPVHLGEAETNQFLTHLAVQKKVSASTQNQALCAIVFLYKHVLQKDLGDFGPLIWAKKSKRLPVVLSNEEVSAVFNQLHGTHWIMAMLLYGAGLRLNECLQLRVKDIDFHYNQIFVRNAKGDKDRVTMLPEKVKDKLKEHLKRVEKLHEKDLESGYDIRTVQELLGHRNVNTTMIYTHVLNKGGLGVRSPADKIQHEGQ